MFRLSLVQDLVGLQPEEAPDFSVDDFGSDALASAVEAEDEELALEEAEGSTSLLSRDEQAMSLRQSLPVDNFSFLMLCSPGLLGAPRTGLWAVAADCCCAHCAAVVTYDVLHHKIHQVTPHPFPSLCCWMQCFWQQMVEPQPPPGFCSFEDATASAPVRRRTPGPAGS